MIQHLRSKARDRFRSIAFVLICWLALSSSMHSSAAQNLTAAEKAAWKERLSNLIPTSLEGTRTSLDLAALTPDDIYTVIHDSWANLSGTDVKLFLLSTVVQNDNARMLDILHIGVTDPTVAVQNRALLYAENFGFDTFTEDYDTYLRWHERSAGKPLQDVISSSMRDLVATLATADETRASTLLQILVRSNFTGNSRTSKLRRQAALDANLPDALTPRIKQLNNLMWSAFQVIRILRPSEAFMRRVILPLADAKVESSVRYQALTTLGIPDNFWAEPVLLKMMKDEYPDNAVEIIGQSLAQLGDPHIVPPLISIMISDGTQEGNRIVGNMLTTLTGVNNSFVRDGKWWRTWWEHNYKRFPADMQSPILPNVAVRARVNPAQPGRVPAMPSLKQIAGDAKRAYWLIDPREVTPRLGGIQEQPTIRLTSSVTVLNLADPAGQKDRAGLIVVLTTDGDAASAAAFWQDVAVKALGRNYLIAVVNAPKWTDSQHVVWVTETDMKQFKGATFSTESLVDSVVRDVFTTYPDQINSERVFLHGAGNGAAATYAAALAEKSVFKGFYILSGSFKSAALPPVDRSSTRRFYIQNAKDDKLHPFWAAEAAKTLLTQKGAIVKLEPSSGYLTNQTPQEMYDQIKGCFDWLVSGK